jgi:hypothetical protein
MLDRQQSQASTYQVSNKLKFSTEWLGKEG